MYKIANIADADGLDTSTGMCVGDSNAKEIDGNLISFSDF